MRSLRAPAAVVCCAILLAIAAAPCAEGADSDAGLPIGPVALAGDEPHLLLLSAGAFDVAREHEHGSQGVRPEGQVEFRLGRKLLYVAPIAGLLATGGGGLYGYGGFAFTIDYGPWKLLPGFMVGRYRRGQSKNLGGPLIFGFEVPLVHRFENGIMCGITFSHISNAFRYSHNPGAESALVTLVLPLGG